MEEQTQGRKRPNKKEHIQKLLNFINKSIREGNTPDEAIGKLSMKQYDFLIDNDVNLDKLLLTADQQKTLNEIKRTPRKVFENGYNKKYPLSKQELYNSIVLFLKSQNATIQEREKQNYRDIDFIVNNERYKIVLSQPRSVKEGK